MSAIFCPDGHAHQTHLDSGGFECYSFLLVLGRSCKFNNFRLRERETNA